MPSSSHFFNAISNTKDFDQYTQGEIDKDYKPYLINRMVAQYKNLIFVANEMNQRGGLAKEHQLQIYMDAIPKKNRQVLWINKTKNRELNIVMKYYNITQEKADPYMYILTLEQIDELESRMETGGK